MQMLQPQKSGPTVRTILSTHELLPFRSGHAHPLLQRDTHPKMRGLPFPHAVQIHLLEVRLLSDPQHDRLLVRCSGQRVR